MHLKKYVILSVTRNCNA